MAHKPMYSTEASWPSSVSGRVLEIGHIDSIRAKHERLSVADLLGGKAKLGADLPIGQFDPLLWHNIIDNGMPLGAADTLRKSFRASQKDWHVFLRIGTRTFQRSRKTAASKAKLGPDESARILSVAAVLERAVAVFEDTVAADQWLAAPNQALAGGVPLDLARNPLSAQSVLDALNAIEHGMFA